VALHACGVKWRVALAATVKKTAHGLPSEATLAEGKTAASFGKYG
jgi:hypothetical protein